MSFAAGRASPLSANLPLTLALFTAVDDRIFSTAVDCTYTIPISSSSLTRSAIGNLGIDFEAIYRSVEMTTLEIFATHNSASVQATLYQMCEKILKDNRHVGEVTYKLPNKVNSRVLPYSTTPGSLLRSRSTTSPSTWPTSVSRTPSPRMPRSSCPSTLPLVSSWLPWPVTPRRSSKRRALTLMAGLFVRFGWRPHCTYLSLHLDRV